uniref:Uncharacterized protein n=1 Tax=Chromera velia CCMP2878 TaxID=1169474 RepID=A0A0G4FG43_9ALVE|eukprot:Cvel_16823.t1-p1 / transcript=Cvel_16823.t1 / gene=Cvel_16823 / organism=Chromera_velia_CCMP2878 / gene_product=Probable cation-transporting ATPase 13A4, putative / transcript_product=Probable cation-transporting ATPase 13A4, putative / location=Cvel_scaffold1314:8487-16398(-) / protein_length=1472 / sequence_SO=supercontig / SO=protein_coding / is_pseudo=false
MFLHSVLWLLFAFLLFAEEGAGGADVPRDIGQTLRRHSPSGQAPGPFWEGAQSEVNIDSDQEGEAEAASRYPTGPDATKNPLIQNFFTYPPLIVIYLFIVSVIVNGIVWHINRQNATDGQGEGLRVKSSHKQLSELLSPQEQGTAAEGEAEEPRPPPQRETETSVEVEVEPLKSNQWGSASTLLISAVSVLWMLLFLCVCIDQYLGCQLRGVDNLCYYGYYIFTGAFNRNANFYFTLWCCCVPWYLVLMLLSKDRLWERWAKIPCSAAEADAVFVKALAAEEGAKVRVSLAPLQKEETAGGETVEFFVFEGKRFLRDQTGAGFGTASVDLPSDAQELHKAGASGLTEENAAKLHAVVGPNSIDFKRQSFAALLQKEFCQPFYLYQLACYMFWIWFSYLFVGLAMLSMALVAGLAKVFVTANAEATLEKITSHRSTAEVKRSGEWKEMPAEDLVPGDVIKIKGDETTFPCDCILLKGTCVCDEAALTGEARPIEKVALPVASSSEKGGKKEVPARHRLFAGTIAMQSLGAGGEQGGAEALVAATGLQTGKGDLVSSILFPRAPDRMKWDAEMGLVWIGLFIYSGACFIFAVHAVMAARPEAKFVTVITYGILTISQTLSPMLPVALSAGQVRALTRLNNRGIVCVNPEKIAVAGKVRVAAFDKTGTLTKDELEFIGAAAVKVKGEEKENVHPGAVQEASKLHEPECPTKTLRNSQGEGRERGTCVSPMQKQQSLDLLLALSSCHAVADFGGHLVGNQVEVQMATASGWGIENVDGKTLGETAGPLGPCAFCRLTPPESHRQSEPGARELLVLRRCEFDHGKQTMSVVVQEEGRQGKVPGRTLVFCKGSFEALSTRCVSTVADTGGVVPASGGLTKGGGVPTSLQSGGEIEQEARGYALDGCYVIALGAKEILPGTLKGPSDLLGLSREEIESDLCFMGLLLFRNELKPCSHDAILELRTGGIRPVLITGDNAQCGQYIARMSGVLGRDDAQLLLGETFPLSDARELRASQKTVKEEKNGAKSRQRQKRGSLLLGSFAESEAGREGASEGANSYIGSERRKSIARSLSDLDAHDDRVVLWSDVKGAGHWYSTKEVAGMGGLWDGSVQLAVTGAAWDSLLGSGGHNVRVSVRASAESGEEVESDGSAPLLFFIRLFARMTPGGKVEVVEEFKKRGNITVMVGDGGNDCGALRAAHVGVAFSEADASIVSPFTAKDKSVKSVVEALREGRGALHTSFACFFFALLFGLVFSLIKITAFSFGIQPCPATYLTADLGGLLALTFLMSLVEPTKEDAGGGAAERPQREREEVKAMHRMSPTDSLLSRPSLLTVGGFFLAHIVTLVLGLVIMTMHPNYVPFPAQLTAAHEWYLQADSWEQTVVFAVAVSGVISTGLVLSFGFVFRQPVYKSTPVFVACICLFLYVTFLVLSPPNALTRSYHLASEGFNEDPPVKGSVWERYQNKGMPRPLQWGWGSARSS